MANAAAQSPRAGASGVSFSLTPGIRNTFGQGALDGVVAYEVRQNGAWVHRGVEISAEPGEAIAGTADSAAPISADYSLADLERGAAPAAAATTNNTL